MRLHECEATDGQQGSPCICYVPAPRRWDAEFEFWGGRGSVGYSVKGIRFCPWRGADLTKEEK